MFVSSKAAQQELERETRIRFVFIEIDLYPTLFVVSARTNKRHHHQHVQISHKMDFGQTRAHPASGFSWQPQTAPPNTCSKIALITHSRQSICHHAVEIELDASISTFRIVRFLLRNTCKTSLKRVGLSTSTDSPTRCSVTSFVRHISMPITKRNDRKAWRHSLCLPGIAVFEPA